MQKLKTPLLLIGVFVMSFLVGYLVLAWTEPTVLPPGDNVPSPINVGSIDQTKAGGFTSQTSISAPTFYDYNDTSYYINPSSTTISATLAGFVGIGTTTPEKRLTIQGTSADWDNATGGQVKLINSGSCCSSLTLQSTATGGKTYSIMSTGPGSTAGAGALAFYNNTDLMYKIVIDPTGNVGIATSSPTRKLDVSGNIRVRSLSNCDTIDTDLAGNFSCGTDDAGGGAGLWTDDGAYIYPNNYTSLAITDTGRLGIGTTSPLSKVHINFGTPGVDYFRITNDVNTIAVLGDNTSPNDRGMLSLYYNGALATHISATNSYFNNGNVGIGTSSPTRPLDVDGNIRVRGLVSCDTIDTDASGNFTCGTDEGGAGGTLWTDQGAYIYPNNYTSLAITDTGRLGIGTTSPGAKVHISDTGSNEIIIEADTDNVTETDHAKLTLRQDGGAVVGFLGFHDGTNRLLLKNEYNDRLEFGANNTIHMTILNNGRVGIGTTNPSNRFHVDGGNARVCGDIYVCSGGSLGVRTDVPTQALDVDGNIRVRGLVSCDTIDTDASGNFTCGTDEGGAGGGVGGSGAATRVAFWTAADTIGSDTELYWDNTNKRLGIGTSTPGYKLDVQGGDARIQNLQLGGTGSEGSIYKTDRIVGYNDLRLWPDSSQTSSEVLFLNGSGQLGVGTSSPGVGGYGAKLDVVGGNIRVQGGALSIYNPAITKTWHLTYDTSGYFYIDEVGTGRHLAIRNGGSVGLGTTDPVHKLDVRGSFFLSGPDLEIDAGSGRGGDGPGGSPRRALVHAPGDILAINYAGDYTGGTRIDGDLAVGGLIKGKVPYATASRTGDTNCNGVVGTVLSTTITVDRSSTILVFSSVQTRYTNSTYYGLLWLQRGSTDITGQYMVQGWDGSDWKPAAVNGRTSVSAGTYTISLRCWGESYNDMGIGPADLIVIAFSN